MKNTKAAGNVVKLYPNENFKKSRLIFENDKSFSNYLDWLFSSQTASELELTQTVNLEEVLTASAVDQTGLEKLQALWSSWNELSERLGYLDWPSSAPATPPPLFSEVKKEPSELTKIGYDFAKAMETHFDDLGAMKDSLKTQGIGHLPVISAYRMLEFNKALRDDLGFDILADLEEYVVALDKSLPKQVDIKNNNKNKKPVARDLLVGVVADHWAAIGSMFFSCWKNALIEINASLRTKINEDCESALMMLGKAIYLSNTVGGLIYMFAQDIDVHINNFPISIIWHSDLNQLPENIGAEHSDENNANSVVESEDGDDFEKKLIAGMRLGALRFCELGIDKDSAGRFSVEYSALMMRVLGFDHLSSIDDLDKAVENVLNFSQLLLPTLRADLLQYLTTSGDESFMSNHPGIVQAAFAYQPNFIRDHLSVSDSGEVLEKIFDTLGFSQNPVTYSAFIDAAEMAINSTENDHEYLSVVTNNDDFFYAAQEIFNKFLFDPSFKYTSESVPSRLEKLESLHYHVYSDYVPSTVKPVCPAWAIAMLLLEEDETFKFRDQPRSEMFLNTVEHFIEHGLVTGAANLFLFYLVTESLEIYTRLSGKYGLDSEEHSFKVLAPFGEWDRLNKIFLKIGEYGFDLKAQKISAFVRDFFKDSKHPQLNFAAHEIGKFANQIVDADAPTASANILKIVQEDHKFLEARMLDVMGESWLHLPNQIQQRILKLERNHDFLTGNDVIDGQKSYDWLAPYISLIEAEVKKKVQPLWADPMYGKDLEQSYFSQTQKNNLSNKMSIGQALLVLKGAVLIGNQRILSFMKDAGVDVHFIARELADELLNGPIKVRNAIVHDGAFQPESVERARFIALKCLPKLMTALGA